MCISALSTKEKARSAFKTAEKVYKSVINNREGAKRLQTVEKVRMGKGEAARAHHGNVAKRQTDDSDKKISVHTSKTC